jgi:8-oxo-dGTP pyrophosphatase MutT (NUDIX family)
VTTDALVRAALNSGLTVTLTILPRGWIDIGSPTSEETFHGIEHDDPAAMLRRSLLGGSPVISAGGVARRQHQDCEEVLLVGDGNPGAWRIPKGMVEQNESIEAAALREVAEETGYQTRLEDYIGSAHWSYEYRSVPQEELVHFYSLTVLSSVNCRDAEHSAVAWHSLNDAVAALQYEEERAIVRRLQSIAGQTMDVRCQ